METTTTAAPAAAPTQSAAPQETTAPATTAAPASSNPSTDWTSGLNDDFKGYVQSKGFKDPTAVVDSYRNLEKLLGAPKERLLRLPEKDDDPAWKEVYKRMGAPDTAEDYKVEASATDPEFAKWAKGTFHELGLSRKQAESLAGKFNQYAESMKEKFTTTTATKSQEEAATLKKEWGVAHEQNLDLAKRAAKAFGVTGEQIDALQKQMGFAGVMKHFHAIGTKMGEDSFVEGGKTPGGFGVMTPEQAKSKINSLMSDRDFGKRYASGETSAKEEMDKLHKWAYSQTT